MKQFCIVERDSHEFHAGSKARNDVGEILTAQGWTALPVHRSQGKGTPDVVAVEVDASGKYLSTCPPGTLCWCSIPWICTPRSAGWPSPFCGE